MMASHNIDYVETRGQVDYSGKVGYLPQLMDDDWLPFTVEEFFLKQNPISTPEFERFNTFDEIETYVKRFRMSIDFDQLIGSLSGGEKIKIQVIKLLLESPDIYLLDEPTNDLDLETIEWLEEFIQSSKKPVVFISHDETLLENVATKIVHLEMVKKKLTPRHTVSSMGYKKYYEERIGKLRRQSQEALAERRAHKKQVERFQQIYNRVEHEQNVISRGDPSGARLLAKKMKSLKSQEKRLENQEFTEIPVVEESIDLMFEDTYLPNIPVLNLSLDTLKISDKVLAKDINLVLKGKTKVTIIGRNGSGKTTLLKQILNELALKDFNVGYFPQNYDELLDYNKSGLDWLMDETDHLEHIVRAHMGSAKFIREEMIQPISSYSGGQKAKLFLIRLILLRCNVLVLDEPTRNLSPLSNPVIRDILNEFDGCVVAVSHDRKFIDEVSDEVYILEDTLKKMSHK
jgi:ATPase subunit of ABC transporter with duplicated ATPase domains